LSAWQYTFLLTSLPTLPALERVRGLPISESMLRARLMLVQPEHGSPLELAEDLLASQSVATPQTDSERLSQLRAAAEHASPASLRRLYRQKFETVLLLAALRVRRVGESFTFALAGPGDELLASIRRHWTDPDFRLGARFRWLAEARSMLDAGHWRALSHAQTAREYMAFTEFDAQHDYAFENVVAYVLRWRLLRDHVAQDSSLAARRFRELLDGTRDRRGADRGH